MERKRAKVGKAKMNFETQIYKTIPIKLINRNYENRKAKRYIFNGTNQNVWIPNKHLLNDGTLKKGENIDYVFRSAVHKLNIAGISWGIQGIKKENKREKVK